MHMPSKTRSTRGYSVASTPPPPPPPAHIEAELEYLVACMPALLSGPDYRTTILGHQAQLMQLDSSTVGYIFPPSSGLLD